MTTITLGGWLSFFTFSCHWDDRKGKEFIAELARLNGGRAAFQGATRIHVYSDHAEPLYNRCIEAYNQGLIKLDFAV